MRPEIRRPGALCLALLLQVFVLSGFIHPCCLDGGGDGGHAAHGSASGTATVSGDSEAPSHEGHHGATPVEDLRGHASHAGSAGMDEGGHDLSPRSVDARESVEATAHEGDHSCGGCEGNCGLCCQTAGTSFLPGPVHVTVRPDAAHRLLRPARLATTTLPAPPAFLLPFANAPPSPATVTI